MKVTGSAGMRFSSTTKTPKFICLYVSVSTRELWVQAPAIVSGVLEGGQLPIHRWLVLSEMPQSIQDTSLQIPGVSHNLLHLEGLLSDKQRIPHSTQKWYQMPKCKQASHAPHQQSLGDLKSYSSNPCKWYWRAVWTSLAQVRGDSIYCMNISIPSMLGDLSWDHWWCSAGWLMPLPALVVLQVLGTEQSPGLAAFTIVRQHFQ